MRRDSLTLTAGLLLGALAIAGVSAPAVAATAMPATVAPAAATFPRSAMPAVPDDVATWFAEEAAQVIADSQQRAVTLDDGETAIEYTTVEVGEPRALRTWSDRFRAGDAEGEATADIPQWIAPVVERGVPVGTVSAFRDAGGAVGLAYFDDAAALASRLLALEESQQVVYDGPLDAYFVIDGGSVAPLSENSRAELSSAVPLDAFQPQLTARYAGSDDGETLPRTDPLSALAGGGAGVPTHVVEQAGSHGSSWLPVGIGLALVSAAALAMTARGGRRRADARQP